MASADERFLIVAPDGRVVFDTKEELVGQPMAAGYEERGAPIVVDGQAVGTLLVTTGDLSGQSELERRFLDAVNQAVFWAVLLVAVASLVAAALLARQLVAPLRQLTAAAEAMAGGDLSQRVEIRITDEVGELGQAFNKMAADLQKAEAQRRQMTADIAHELRNPLSVIRGNLEALLDGIYPHDDEHLAPIYEETLLLQRLVEDLRLLSLADAGQLQLIRTDVDMGALLGGVVDSAQAMAEAKAISLHVSAPVERLVIDGDADRLRQVVGNLVSNALRYTPQGGTIALHARADGDRVKVTVSDSGQGIAPEDLPHVFDRFYRGDAARDRTSGGSGLGLAIAQALVRAHDGTIDVQSAAGQGTTFTVTLSRAG
jgi:signal transduction histidine kinase